MKKAVLHLAAMLAMTTTVSAEDVKLVDIVDFVLDWQNYQGQYIGVTGGAVVFATVDKVMIYSSAGIVLAMPPWRDKNDLRFLLRHCDGPVAQPECMVAVAGIVRKSSFNGTNPELAGADFALPFNAAP